MLKLWTLRAAGAALVIGLAASAGYVAGQGATKLPETPPRTLKVNEIARVADRIVTAEQLIARIYDIEQAMVPERRNLDSALHYLVQVQLLELEAQRIGCEIKQAEVDSVTTTQYENIKKTVKDKFGGAVTWDEWLKQQSMTDEGFKRYLGLRSRIVLLKRLVVNYHFDYEDNIDGAHILVSRQKTADDIYDELKKGAKFEDLAVKYSEDPATSQNGGRLPRHYRGDGIVKEIEDKLWELSDGEYSKPVKSSFGLHIVKRYTLYKGNKARFFDRRGELLARPDIADEDVTGKSYGFHKWVRCVLSRKHPDGKPYYVTERRLPGMDCDPDKP